MGSSTPFLPLGQTWRPPSPPLSTPWVSAGWIRTRAPGRPDHLLPSLPTTGGAQSRVWCGAWGRQIRGMETALGREEAGKGSGRRELVRSLSRPGSRPEAINKPSAARHSRVRASSAAPGADGVGSGEASTDLFINQLWSRHRPAVKSAFEASSSFL